VEQVGGLATARKLESKFEIEYQWQWKEALTQQPIEMMRACTFLFGEDIFLVCRLNLFCAEVVHMPAQTNELQKGFSILPLSSLQVTASVPSCDTEGRRFDLSATGSWKREKESLRQREIFAR